jgi:hypothetical protein
MVCFEAFNGTTMTELEQREGLRTGGQKYEQIK